MGITRATSASTAYATPAAADFTTTRDQIAGTFSVADDADSDGVLFTMANAAGTAAGVIGQSVGAGAWTVEAALFAPPQVADSIFTWGLAAMDTTNEEAFAVRLFLNGTGIADQYISAAFFNNFALTEGAATSTGIGAAKRTYFGQMIFFKMVNDTTNIKAYASLDLGASYIHVATQAVSGFTNGPTITGIIGSYAASSGTSFAICPHFQVT